MAISRPDSYNSGQGINDSLVGVAGVADPNQTVVYALAGIAAVPYLYCTIKSRIVHIIALALLLGVLVSVISTGSRAGIIVIAIMLVYFLIFGLRFIPLRPRLFFLSCTALAVLSLGLYSTRIRAFGMSSYGRFAYAFAVGAARDGSIKMRVEANRWLLRSLIATFPLTGMGYSQFHDEIGRHLPGGRFRVRYPHASLVDAYVIGGAPMLAALFLLWTIAFRRAWRMTSHGVQIEQSQGYFLFSMLLGLFVMHLGLSLVFLKLQWAILGAAMAAKNTKDHSPVTDGQET